MMANADSTDKERKKWLYTYTNLSISFCHKTQKPISIMNAIISFIFQIPVIGKIP